MALVMIYAVLSHFDLVAKFTVNNLNKDFINTGQGGVTVLRNFFIKFPFFASLTHYFGSLVQMSKTHKCDLQKLLPQYEYKYEEKKGKSKSYSLNPLQRNIFFVEVDEVTRIFEGYDH